MGNPDPDEGSYHSGHDATDFDSEWISLAPAMKILWSYRKAMGVALVTLMLLYAVFGLVAHLSLPSEQLTTVTFRVLFDGAERGQYPNGMLFSGADVRAPSVLAVVFASNELDRYLSYEDFEASVFVLGANPEVTLLSYEYQSRLADTSLSAVDRTRIEAEYEERLASLTAAIFSLSFRQMASDSGMPPSLRAKVAEDTLATWARQAEERRGALMYDVPVFSTNSLKWALFEVEDYYVAADMLRIKIRQAAANIDELSVLPGATVMRVGDERLSLADLRLQLEDILQFEVQPLLGLIRATGVSKDPDVLATYVGNQLTQRAYDRDEARQRLTVLQNGLAEYTGQRSTLTPIQAQSDVATSGQPAQMQFGESLLDRLIDMSTRQVDIEYRQRLTDAVIEQGYGVAALEREVAYYEELDTILKQSSNGRGGTNSREQIVSNIEGRTRAAFDRLAMAVGNIETVYEELSTYNLNAARLLYQITSPATTRVEHSFSLRDVAVRGMVIFALGLVLIPLACLAHGSFRREIAQG